MNTANAARERVDAVVVGSGMAGSLIAAALAKAGKRTVVLEGGPERKLTDLTSSQLWSRRLKWAGPAVETGGASPLSVGFGSGWGTGGSALHHYACWFRLHAEDFEMKSRFGRGNDWPLRYDDLRPHYDAVQAEVGICGDAEREVWRPAGEAYPMPPVPVWAQGRMIAKGFEKLGMRTSALPLAIRTAPAGERKNCLFDGWCDAGCPIGALANPLVTYLPQALAAGAELRHECTVTRVLTTADGRRATGVEWFDREGTRHELEASVVVLAAYVFEIPRILFNSRAGGLANSSGMLGRSMMAHSTANVFGFFEDETENHMGATGGQLLCQDDYLKDPKRGYLGGYQWLIGNAMKPNDLLGIAGSRVDLYGDPLDEFLRRAAKHLATMTFVGEGIPDPDNRVVLSDRKDRHGFPLAKVTHAFGKDAIACWEAGMKQGLEVFRAAGADKPWHGGRAQMHTMGGAIMGASAKDSVTNSHGQAHDVPNLFVAGSSLFPTSGAVNPTFTLAALAHRTSGFMVEKWSSFT